MNKLSWAALRHIEALRESVSLTLQHGAVAIGTKQDEAFYAEWLREQEIEPVVVKYVTERKKRLDLLRSMEAGIRGHGVDLLHAQLAGSGSRFDEQDIGVNRSSVGWQRLPNFILSSAFVRLLGAMEQFELDVLKALLYYRPEGKMFSGDAEEVVAELAVVTEKPDKDGRFTLPALWSWLHKPAENTVERRKLFKSVFEIECFPSTFGKLKPTEIRSYYQDAYDKRNAIAHGRELIEVSLGDYCKADAYVLALVSHMSSVCRSKYKLAV